VPHTEQEMLYPSGVLISPLFFIEVHVVLTFFVTLFHVIVLSFGFLVLMSFVYMYVTLTLISLL